MGDAREAVRVSQPALAEQTFYLHSMPHSSEISQKLFKQRGRLRKLSLQQHIMTEGKPRRNLQWQIHEKKGLCE